MMLPVVEEDPLREGGPTPVTPETLRLQTNPGSAARARSFIREHATLDSMRHTEADLLVTELVANVIQHASSAGEFELTVDLSARNGVEVAVSHEHSVPLTDFTPGVGFKLMERLAREWGHEHDGCRLRVWFLVRKPGSLGLPQELSDDELAARMAGDPACSDELVRRHRDLAISISKRYRRKGIAEEDLKQVALMGLLKAIQRYDPALGELRPYAAATISGELKRLLRDKGWSLRVPRPVQERALAITRASEELTHKLNRDPSHEEIAEYLSITEDEVAEAIGARLVYTSRSIDTPAVDSGASLLESLPGDSSGLEEAEVRLLLEDAIFKLPERQRLIMRLRFEEDMTQSEIADIVGISQMHVSRLLAKALEAMREHLVSEEEASAA